MKTKEALRENPAPQTDEQEAGRSPVGAETAKVSAGDQANSTEKPADDGLLCTLCGLRSCWR